MKFLLECVKHLESDLVPKFLKEVLKALVEMKGGSEKVVDMMTQSGVTIQQLLPADKVAEFISTTVWLKIISFLLLTFLKNQKFLRLCTKYLSHLSFWKIYQRCFWFRGFALHNFLEMFVFPSNKPSARIAKDTSKLSKVCIKECTVLNFSHECDS